MFVCLINMTSRSSNNFSIVPETPHPKYRQVVTCRAPQSYGKDKFAETLNKQFDEWRNEGHVFECSDNPEEGYETRSGFCARVVFY